MHAGGQMLQTQHRETGRESSSPQKFPKRRAAQACVSCRARKVRCDVVEGAPCGNCRWDGVECIVQESRRRKKNTLKASIVSSKASSNEAQSCHASLSQAPLATTTPPPPPPPPLRSSSPTTSPSTTSESASGPSPTGSPEYAAPPLPLIENSTETKIDVDVHVPRTPPPLGAGRHCIDSSSPTQQTPAIDHGRPAQSSSPFKLPAVDDGLPDFIRPLPAKIASEDVLYLAMKGALTLPHIVLQNALLQCYIEFVYPYMPLIELHSFLNIVNQRDGSNGQISLLLYQSIMFSASAFVDMKYLTEAGYSSRKMARKAFFQKTRLLYDFDYEQDRLVLVQSLMQMTYWYETPDDQKDTWHWMGVAISLAQTIGLNRNPATTAMTPSMQRLWKRVWWSCFMRDRLIALGMRRPTRIKDEDFDVPMLEDGDFEIQLLADDINIVPSECTLIRDTNAQRDLAAMCIAKAKLCVCISHVLKAQYSVLLRDKMKPESTTNSTMMLFPNKQRDNVDSVNSVDSELVAWDQSLPQVCQYRPLIPLDVQDGRSTVAVQRMMLHMVYHTTVSALHRPQYLPSPSAQACNASRQMEEKSRLRVRRAAAEITRMAMELRHFQLVKYLPTTGVTVILPAMIVHLLEMKCQIPLVRDRAMKDFLDCMRFLHQLRETYASADFATGFLDAALKKTALGIDIGLDHPITLALRLCSASQNLVFGVDAQTPPAEKGSFLSASVSMAEPQLGSMPPPEFVSEPMNVLEPEHATPPQMASSLIMSESMGDPESGLVPARLRELPPTLTNGAAATLPVMLDPQIGFDLPELSPGSSTQSEEHLEDSEMRDVCFPQDREERDWTAVTHTELQDAWVMFPADTSMAGGDHGDGGTAATASCEDSLESFMYVDEKSDSIVDSEAAALLELGS